MGPALGIRHVARAKAGLLLHRFCYTVWIPNPIVRRPLAKGATSYTILASIRARSFVGHIETQLI